MTNTGRPQNVIDSYSKCCCDCEYSLLNRNVAFFEGYEEGYEEYYEEGQYEEGYEEQY